jgi:hypothetical protein
MAETLAAVKMPSGAVLRVRSTEGFGGCRFTVQVDRTILRGCKTWEGALRALTQEIGERL